MPTSDLGPRLTAVQRLRIAQRQRFVRRLRGPKRPGGEAGEAVPVRPDRPLDLSGGAAAALEFDD